MPVNIPSQNRARAFLWLVYNYLEEPISSSPLGTSNNPFSDQYSRDNPGKIPWLPCLSSDEMRKREENIDPADEVDWGNRMCAKRINFLQRLTSAERERKDKNMFKPPQSTPGFLMHDSYLRVMISSFIVLELAPRRPRAPRQVYKGDETEGFRHYAPPTPSYPDYSTSSSASRLGVRPIQDSSPLESSIRRTPSPELQPVGRQHNHRSMLHRRSNFHRLL